MEHNSTSHPSNNALYYVALGLQEQDAGYDDAVETLHGLGVCSPLPGSLWRLESGLTAQEILKHVNRGLLDRRIDSQTVVFVLDLAEGHAKWFLRQPLSDLLCAHWDYGRNLFVSFSLHDAGRNQYKLIEGIGRLGIWAPISRTFWYVSSPYSSKAAFQFLLPFMLESDELCVFDSSGNHAIWQGFSSAVIKSDRHRDRAPLPANQGKGTRAAIV